MTQKSFCGLVGLVVLATVATVRASEVAPVEVVEVSTMNISTQFASMQAELDELRARLEQVSYGGEVGCGDCGKGGCYDCGSSCGCDCFCDIGCGGWYGGAEAVIVRPHFGEEVDFLGPAVGGGQFDPRYDYAVSPRIFLGYRNCRGTGIRARYWMFDQDAAIANGPDLTVSRLEVHSIDAEFTQLVCWGPLQSNFAAGVRYATVENELEELFGGAQPGGALRTLFDGFGPTIAMENRVPLGCSNLSVVGNLRGTLLFGESHYTVRDPVVPETVTLGRDDLVAVAEIQVGLEWKRCTRFGMLSAYAMLEGQWWSGAVANLGLDAIIFPIGGLFRGFSTNEDLGFVGGTVGLQLAR